MDLGPRPNTIEPSTYAVIEITSDQIESMSNHDLTTWLVARTSMWINPELPRTKYLTEFMRAAHDIQ